MPDPTRDNRIVFKVTEREKEKIEEAVDGEPNVQNRSDFIRLAVTQKIHGVLDQEAIENLEVGLDEGSLPEIESEIEDVKQELQQARDEIIDAINTDWDEEEIDNLTRRIFQNLPVYESHEDMIDPEQEHKEYDPETDEEDARVISTPSAWADWFDVDVAVARRACAHLEEYYPGEVIVMDDSGYNAETGEFDAPSERRYFRYTSEDKR